LVPGSLQFHESDPTNRKGTLSDEESRRRRARTPAEHAGGSLALSGLTSATGVIVLTLTALVLSLWGAGSELIAMTWALAGVMPFVLMREFGRRFTFAHLQISQTLLLDATVAAIQLAALFSLGWTGCMSAVTACAALGGACGLTALAWLYCFRAEFAIRVSQLRAALRQSWGLGKWLFGGQLTVQVQHYITYWLLVVIAGAAVTGVYTACMSVVAFANPLMFGIRNILAPRSVLAWKTEGGTGLKRQAVRDALLLAAIMTSFCLVVLFAGEDVLRFLYRGKEYEGHGHVLTVLALAMLASAVGMPASNALASMERPRAIVLVGTMSATLTVALVWWWMTQWGLLGAAYGFLAGNVVGALGRWAAFLALVPRACDPAPAVRVLQTLMRSSNDEGWIIARLDEGDHAVIYRVQSQSQQPIWRTYHSLIIKLYKPAAPLKPEIVQAQFDALSRLHAALDGRTVAGWKISAPRPLSICNAPLALVMTAVPGRALKSCAAADDLAPEVLDAAARAFVGAMQECWSRDEVHGDLAPRNILCDAQTRHLSFVDPGTPESCHVCNGTAKRRHPAVLDLAHVLWELGTDVMDTIGDPIARLRRQMFAENAARAFVATIGQAEDKQHVLNEIRACAHAHMSERYALLFTRRHHRASLALKTEQIRRIAPV
jgi:O-antigen/teichoic acid export membrane protein